MSPSSAPSRRITGSGLRCWKRSPSVTISNCSETRRRRLPAASPLHRCFQGEVWGADMYQALRRSKITLNSHIDMAGREAGNMRLFEATGVGAFLLTDFKDNLHTLFAPDREVAVWRSIDDCLAGDRPRARRRRWPRGDRACRPGEDHGAAYLSPSRGRDSGLCRRQASAAMKLPRIVRQIGKRVVQATPILRRHILSSTDYRVLGGVDEARERDGLVGRMACGTHGAAPGARLSGPDRSHEARRTAARFHASRRKPSQRPGSSNPRLLEIGCGSGYYSEVFATLLPGRRPTTPASTIPMP